MKERVNNVSLVKKIVLLIMSAVTAVCAVFGVRAVVDNAFAGGVILIAAGAVALILLSGLYKKLSTKDTFGSATGKMGLTMLSIAGMMGAVSCACGLLSVIVYSCMKGASDILYIKGVITLLAGVLVFLITPFFVSLFFAEAKSSDGFRSAFKAGILPGALRYAKLAAIQAGAFFAGFGIEKGMTGTNAGILVLKALIYTGIGFIVFLLSSYVCGSDKRKDEKMAYEKGSVRGELQNARAFSACTKKTSGTHLRTKLSKVIRGIAFKAATVWIMILCLAGLTFPLSAFAEEPSARRVDFSAPEEQSKMNTAETVAEDTEGNEKDPIMYYEETEDEPAGQLIDVDEYSKTYKTGERSFTTEISGEPNTYERQGNTYYIDNTLVEKGNSYENLANDYTVRLPQDLNKGKGVTVSKDGYTVELIPLEGDFTHSVTKKNAIIYNNVFENIDFQYTALSSVLKEDIVLNSPTDKTEFAFKIKSGALDVTESDGVIFVYDKKDLVRETGEKRVPDASELNAVSKFTITAPVMEDANGEVSFAVNLSLDESSGEQILTLKASEEWLSDPARVYPVRIDPTVSPVVITDIGMYGVEEGHADMVIGDNGYPYCGYDDGITSTNWYESNTMHMRTRTYIKVNYDFSQISKEARIDSARLDIGQRTKWSKGDTDFGLYRVENDWSPSSITWNSQINYAHEFISFSKSLPYVGYISWDLRDTVNDWVQGLSKNNGLVLKAKDERYMQCEVFFNHKGEKPPKITINWSVPDPVDTGYALDNTTVNLRPVTEKDIKGKQLFDGVFPDGVATPESIVAYTLTPDNKNGVSFASLSYKYPDSTLFSSISTGATKYKDKLSNWQGDIFSDVSFDKIYQYKAAAVKAGVTGKEVASDTFLIYQVKDLDTFPSIASHYGVPLNTIMRDNRVQDTLMVKGNTIFIRNPKTDKAYTPTSKSTDAKKKIDSALMGRGLHCQYGFEPVNLNTGNFLLESTDVSLDEYTDEWGITRTYNSKSDLNSVFGMGWSFEYAKSISKDEEGNILYRDGDGKVLEFKKEGDKFISPSGYHYELKEETYKRQVESLDADPEKRGKQTEETFTKYKLIKPDGSTEDFNSWGLLESIKDSKGFITKLTYDDNFSLISIETPSGKTFKISADSFGGISRITRPDGKELNYTYDDNGYLVSYTDANENVIRYIYDASGRMTEWYDANGSRVIKNEYDDEGRVVRQTDANGGVSTLFYTDNKTVTTDANGNKTTYTLDHLMRITKTEYPNGKVVIGTYDKDNNLSSSDGEEYSYDSKGNRTSVTRKDGSKYTYIYNDDCDITSVTDPEGKKTVYDYRDGDLIKVTYATGETEDYTYNKTHQPITHTDANGNTEKFVYEAATLTGYTDNNGNEYKFYYDTLNRLTSIQNPDGTVKRTAYDAEGNIIKEQAGDGGETIYGLDKNGNPVKVTDPEGGVSTITLDKMANITAVTDANGNTTSFEYDGNGNETKVTDPEGAQTHYAYDVMDRITKITDADGRVSTYEYDLEGNVVKVTDADGAVISAEYNKLNLPVTQTDKLGRVTRITYTAADETDTITKPDDRVLKYVYDKRDRLIGFTDENGEKSEFELDGTGNTITLTETGTDKSTRLYKYTYDKNGNVLTETNPQGGIKAYTYDAMNRKASETDENGNVTEFSYDVAGRNIKVTDALGGISKTSYDKNGNVVKETDALGAESIYNYDPVGNLISKRDALGAVTNYSYDKNDRLVKVIDALKGESTYSYTKIGSIESVTDASGNTTRFGYDKADNITSITLPTGDKSLIEYDKGSRVVKITDEAGLITKYTYDAGDRVLSQEDNAGNKSAYKYDDYGRLISRSDIENRKETLEYNGFSEVISVTGTDGNKTRYEYDKLGNILSEIKADNTRTDISYDKVGNITGYKENEATYKYKYDEVYNLIEEINPLGEKQTFSYDAEGNTTSVTDGNGIKISYAYDKLGRLIKETDGNGADTSYTYDPLGRLSSITDALGAVTEYRYDATGNITKVKDANNHVTEYKYDSLYNLIKEISPKGAETLYEYNKHGDMIKLTDALRGVTEYDTDLNGSVTKITQANGSTYTYNYDGLHRLTGITTPSGYKKALEYDRKGDVVRESDNLNRIATYEYDILHRLIKTTNPNGADTLLEYDDNGNITTVTDSKGAKTSYTYDLLSRVRQITDPEGKKTTYNYDKAGNITEVIKPGGRKTAYTYDNNYNLTKITDPLGNVTTSEYDKVNRITKTTDALGKSISYKYDGVGNITAVTDASGDTYKYEYDAHDNVSKVINRLGGETKYSYDATDNLTKVTDPAGRQSSYAYDVMGNLTKATDALGQTMTFEYDESGNVTSFTDVSGRNEEYSYDKLGNLTKLKRANGSIQTYDYDKINNLIEKGYAESDGDEPKDRVIYLYDSEGNRLQMDDAYGSASYSYDSLGRLTSVTSEIGRTVKYEYDECDRLEKITYSTGKEVTYGYDKNDRLISVKEEDNETTYAYDAIGRVIKTERFDGSISAYEYNEKDEIVRLTNSDSEGKVLSEFIYTYDPEGNIITETATDEEGIETKRTYAYNISGELTAAKETTGSEKIIYFYEYDDAGNRTKLTKSGAEEEIIEYEYEDGILKAQISSLSGKAEYMYNENGDLVREKGDDGTYTTYEYTIESRLKAVKEGASILMAAAYDGDGNRILQVTRRERMIEKDTSETRYTVKKPTTEDVRLVTDPESQGTELTSTEGETQTRPPAETDKDTETAESKLTGKAESTESADTAEDTSYTAVEEPTFHAFLYGFLHGLMELFAALNSSLLSYLSGLINASLISGNAGYSMSDIDMLKAAGLSAPEIKLVTGRKTQETVSEADIPTADPKDTDEEHEVVIPGKHREIKETYYDLTRYVNDVNTENTQVLEEYGQGGVLKSTHIYGNERISTDVTATSDSIIHTITGVPTVPLSNTSTAYDLTYLYDARGSVAQTVTDNIITGSFSYDPFGNTTTKVSRSDNYYGYNAEETNSITGLQYLRARYYSSDIGRFISADTYLGNLTDPLSQNRYSYTENNPVNYIDPTGHVSASMFSVLGGLNAPVTKRQGYNAFKKEYQYAPAVKKTTSNTTRRTTTNYSPRNSLFNTYIQPKAQFTKTYATQKQAYFKDYMSPTRLQIISNSRKVSFEEKIKKASCESYKTYINASRNQLSAKKQAEASKPWYEKVGTALAKNPQQFLPTTSKTVFNAVMSVKDADWGKVAQAGAVIGLGAAMGVAVVSATFSMGATSPLVVMTGSALVAAIAAYTAAETQEVITDGESNYLKSFLGEELYEDGMIFTHFAAIGFTEYVSSKAAAGAGKSSNKKNNTSNSGMLLKQEKTVDDILYDLKETTNKRGVARNFESSGGYKNTIKDFESLQPVNVKEIDTKYGTGRWGELKNGTIIVARPGSETGGATLEIRESKNKIFKIRY